MDTSDFYDTAVTALAALEEILLPTPTQIEAIHELRDFIRAADREREENNTRAFYKAHIKEGDRT